MIPLVRDVPLDVHVDQLTLGGWDLKTAEAVFAKYELKTHWQPHGGAAGRRRAGRAGRRQRGAARLGHRC